MLKTARVGVQRILGRLGCRLVRVENLTSGCRARMMRHHGIKTVVDVGANLGQYASELREFGYSGRIISFEPTGLAYEGVAARSRSDPSWTVYKVALGDVNGEATIHVAANRAASSSLLPMLAHHKELAPDARFIAEEKVLVRTLDSALDGLFGTDERLFLKIDAQGYEDRILKGASNVLAQAKILECELSFVPLYEGQILFEQLLTLLGEKGFSPVHFAPEFIDHNTGHTLQVNGIFVRRSREVESNRSRLCDPIEDHPK